MAMQQGRGFNPALLSHLLHSHGRVFILLLVARRQQSAKRVTSQPVHPERVLGGGVSQHHVGVIEHVQPIQGEGVDL